MAFEEGGNLQEPVSPTGQYFNSSVMSVTVLGVLEFELPIDDSPTIPLLENVFLPISSRFSSIMVKGRDGKQEWKRVDVNLEDHIYVPTFPSGLSPEQYDYFFDEYLTKISTEQLPQSRPLWEIHIIKYPTSNSAGNVVFKLHHALGDGYSLMGALLSCLQRADNPSLPLTFPSRESSNPSDYQGSNKCLFGIVPKCLSMVFNTISDFGWSILKSTFLGDDRTPIRSGIDGMETQPKAISTIKFSLDQIKEIKAKLRVTVNDVLTGMVFLGLRLYMEEISHESRKLNPTALILLNTRMIDSYKSIPEMLKPNTKASWGNQFAFIHVPIPTLTGSNLTNPLLFVKKAQKTIKKKRTSFGVLLTGRLIEMVRKLKGPKVGARYIYKTLHNSSTGITNMIGPVEKVALSNNPVKGMYFMVNGVPQSLVITVLSYMGDLRIAFGTEKGFIDEKKLLSCMENALKKIQDVTA